MIVGDGQKDVVCDVGSDIVVNAIDKTIIAINGGEGSLEKLPTFAAVPRNIGLSVV